MRSVPAAFVFPPLHYIANIDAHVQFLVRDLVDGDDGGAGGETVAQTAGAGGHSGLYTVQCSFKTVHTFLFIPLP